MSADPFRTDARPGVAGFHVPSESAALARLAAVTAELVAAESMQTVIGMAGCRKAIA